METSRDLPKKKEEIIGQLNCPKAVRCYQFRYEKFAEAKQIGGAVWLLECLEINPLECAFAQFSADAGSYVCTCPVRTYVAGKNRRKHKRFAMGRHPVAAAFVTSSVPHFVMSGRMTDIGDGGLALFHFGGRLPPHSSLELDIILPGRIGSMKKLTGDSSWDIETQGEVRARRCGIQFRNLTDDQKAFLEYVIRNCATAGAES